MLKKAKVVSKKLPKIQHTMKTRLSNLQLTNFVKLLYLLTECPFTKCKKAPFSLCMLSTLIDNSSIFSEVTAKLGLKNKHTDIIM